jgi:steroid delta-isomerase-like uncharacterized protein
MSEQELIDAAKAQLDAYNKKDWDAARAAITADFVYEEIGTQRKIEGSDQVITAWQAWGAAFPDSHATVENAFAGGGQVVLELRWRGRHTGPMQTPGGEIPATGMVVEFLACEVIEIEGGKAKSMRHYLDMMTMMQQLGLARGHKVIKEPNQIYKL